MGVTLEFKLFIGLGRFWIGVFFGWVLVFQEAEGKGDRSGLYTVEVWFKHNIWYQVGPCGKKNAPISLDLPYYDFNIYNVVASHNFGGKSIINDLNLILSDWKQWQGGLIANPVDRRVSPSEELRKRLKKSHKEIFANLKICRGCGRPVLPVPSEGDW